MSLFFIQELIEIVRSRRSQVNMLEFHLRLLEKLLTLNDRTELKQQRIDQFLRFNENTMAQYGENQINEQNQAAGPTSGNLSVSPIKHTLGLFSYLYSQ